MASTVFLLMVMVWLIVMSVLRRFSGGKNASGRNQRSSARERQRRERTFGSAGSKTLFSRKNKDISCSRFDHVHSDWDNSSAIYVSPGEPEEGYIVLNGKKMRRTEADAYENTI